MSLKTNQKNETQGSPNRMKFQVDFAPDKWSNLCTLYREEHQQNAASWKMSSNQKVLNLKKTHINIYKFHILEAGMRNKCREKKIQSYRKDHLLYILRLGSITFLFLKYCHIHCHEYNLSQVTLAKWIIFLTCGTNFLRVFSPLTLFSSLFSGPLKKKTKKSAGSWLHFWQLLSFP